MHLYALTLQAPSGINKALYGNFSGPKAQEVLVSKGKILELMRPDEQTGKLVTVLSHEVFGLIRSMISFRLTGTARDYIIVGSDSGRVVILQYDAEKNVFNKEHQETYGKTGCRRIVPGQFLASDPKGRAFMVSAIEKQKYVYIVNRDANNKLTISSPLEAHKSHTLCFDICGVDVGYENPLFACIEADYGEVDDEMSTVHTGEFKKILTFYEMDLGLNHVVRKSAEEVPNSAHALITVPGDPDGPGGVLVACEEYLLYKNIINSQELIVPWPKRFDAKDKGVFINSHSTFKQKDFFFFLLQTERGDMFKIMVKYTKDTVHTVETQYFDTIPPASSICVLRTGFLFSASEFGNHGFYNFTSLGDEEAKPVITHSAMKPSELLTFVPRELTNLTLIDEIQNLSCITDMKIDDLTGEGNPQIYTLAGGGSYSTLRVLRHGLAINEMASSPLPSKPIAVWTVKGKIADEFDKYIILSFPNGTFVLSIGENVKEVHDSGLDTQKSTLYVGVLEDDSIIQVFSNGIRHIRSDKKINQWLTEGKITKAVSNPHQVVISLVGGEMIYFELDSIGQLAEMEKISVDAEVVCLAIGAIPEGRERSKFLAAGFSDLTVKLYSLEPESCLTKLAMQALPSQPESVCLIEMSTHTESEELKQSTAQLYLHVGLLNGVLLRTAVDSVTGSLTDTRTRFLGSRPVKLTQISIQGQPSMLALSSRAWISYNYLQRYYMTPLTYEALDSASSFASSDCQEGIVGTNGKSLRIIAVEKLGQIFNQVVAPLRYTPRKLLIHPETHNLAVIESDHRACGEAEKQEIIKKTQEESKEPINEANITTPRKEKGQWGSCIRIVEPIQLNTLDILELDNNEAAVTAAIVGFTAQEGELMLVVGTVKDYVLKPKSFSECFIHVYAYQNHGQKITLLHKTPIEDIPMSFIQFKGKLLAGIGKTLRLYDIGKAKLLKKSEQRHFSCGINNISITGDRIFVTDMSDSFHVLRYRSKESQFYEFADDILPRWITTSCILDYNTVAGADKFENIFVCRLPQNVDEDIEEDPLTYKFKWETGYLNGAAFKLEQLCNYFYGELITTMTKTSLATTSNEVLLFGTSMGSIGALYPFETKEDIEFFVHLEMYLRIESLPLCGRDHQMYRSFFGPVRNVVDGDLCEQFSTMEYGKQKVLSEELDRTPAEVLKKLEDIRNKIL